jgi:hypothetical protein
VDVTAEARRRGAGGSGTLSPNRSRTPCTKDDTLKSRWISATRDRISHLQQTTGCRGGLSGESREATLTGCAQHRHFPGKSRT